MKRKFNKSLTLDLTNFECKKFKVLCDTVRSAIKQEHGYNSTDGLTDVRFAAWPVAIRFMTKSNRADFIHSLENLLSENTLEKLSLTKKKTSGKKTRAVVFKSKAKLLAVT